MKHNKNTTRSLLLLPALLAFSVRADDVSFHATAESSVTKTFETSAETSLDEMSIVNNGQEIDVSMIGMEMSQASKYRISVTDEYMSVADGRPSKFLRTYDEINLNTEMSISNAMMGDTNPVMEGTSELEGVRVLFNWDEDAGEYTASFPEDEEGDEDLLEDLAADLDLLGFLPANEVSEDDTWNIEPQVLGMLFAPGGSLKVEIQSEDEDAMGMGGPMPSPEQFIGDFEGEVTGTYKGTREEEGVNVAVIEIAANVTSSKDATEAAQEMTGAMEDQGIEVEIESMDLEIEFEGEGVLLWNIEAGVLYSLELSGEIYQTMDSTMQMSAQGRDMSLEQSLSFAGSQSISVTTESSS